MSTSAIKDITVSAESLDESRLNELAAYALRVKAGNPAPSVELDDDPVLPLLQQCIVLSLNDKRRLNTKLTQIIRRQSAGLSLDVS